MAVPFRMPFYDEDDEQYVQRFLAELYLGVRVILKITVQLQVTLFGSLPGLAIILGASPLLPVVYVNNNNTDPAAEAPYTVQDPAAMPSPDTNGPEGGTT